MARRTHVGPVGTTAESARSARARRTAAYRREQQRLAPYEELARIVIRHRKAQGITQRELAKRMGTSYSAISRIESGQHRTKPDTLRRLAEALGLRFVMGFESGPADRPVRELVTT